MSIISHPLEWNLPKAYNGCQCVCHKQPGVMHFMACCHITTEDTGTKMKYNIKDMVKDGKKVRFVKYKHNQLWYETECGFKFAVDTNDTEDGTFLAEDKAIIFMRYIRKAIKEIEEQEGVQ